MTRVKICGMTRVDDVRAAVDAGASAIGLVFWPHSPRCITTGQAVRLVEALPPFVTAVGVFVDQGRDDVTRIVREVGLGAVQLHGDEPAAEWMHLPVPVLKAAGVDERFEAAAVCLWPSSVVPLLDARDPVRRGGTGTPIDWALAAQVARVRPIVLAGGLTPDTVGHAIRVVAPAAVDVSSGVEIEPGHKCAERMAAFMRAVRAADQQVGT